MAQYYRTEHPFTPERPEERREPPVLTPKEARQGVISGRVFLVLSVSLAIAVVAGAVLLATLYPM